MEGWGWDIWDKYDKQGGEDGHGTALVKGAADNPPVWLAGRRPRKEGGTICRPGGAKRRTAPTPPPLCRGPELRPI